MYDELIKQLRAATTLTDHGLIIHLQLCEEAANAIEDLLWIINYLATCDNCEYFGGCCCDHLDENGKCLGWKLDRIPTKEEKEQYDKLIQEAVDIARQVLAEKKRLGELNISEEQLCKRRNS